MIGNGAGGMSPGAADAKYLKLTGGALSGALAMGNNKITGLATPTANTDAATREFLYSYLKHFYFSTKSADEYKKLAGSINYVRVVISATGGMSYGVEGMIGLNKSGYYCGVLTHSDTPFISAHVTVRDDVIIVDCFEWGGNDLTGSPRITEYYKIL